MGLFDKMFTDKSADAAPDIEELIKKNPSNPNNYIKKGDQLQKEGRYKEAAEAYHKAATLLERDGFFKKALIIYKIIIRIDNNDEKAVAHINKLISEIQSLDTARVSLYTVQEAPEPEQPDIMPEEKAEGKIIADLGEAYESTACAGAPIEATPPVYEKAAASPDPDIEEDVSGISDNDFFKSFTGEELQEIFHRAKVSHYAEGEMVVAEGNPGDSIYGIKDGSARVVSRILDKDIELALLTRGDVFGEVAFLTGRPRTASIIADGPLTMYEMDRQLIENMIEQRPEIMDYLNEVYHLRVKETIKKIRNGRLSKKS